MRKYVSILILLIVVIYSDAQKVIHMEKDGGVYKIPCVVNGAKMKMIFDTGASSVSLSSSMARYLYDNDYISDNDYITEGISMIADGSSSKVIVINLKDIEIAGLHLKNVKAMVSESQNAPLLLGQSAIQQLGSVTLDGDKLIINSYNEFLSDKEIEEAKEKGYSFFEQQHYSATIEELRKLYDSNNLDSRGFRVLSMAYLQTNQFEECVSSCRKWLSLEIDKNRVDSCRIFDRMYRAYYELKKYDESILWTEKAMSLRDISDENEIMNLSDDYYNLARIYSQKNLFYRSDQYFEKAISNYMLFKKITEKDVENQSVDDLRLGVMYYFSALNLFDGGNGKKGAKLMVLSLLCNCEPALDFCRNNNIDAKKEIKNYFREKKQK